MTDVNDVPLEKALRRKVVDVLKEYGLYYESKPPTGMGQSGLDLTVCLRGRFLAIEVKRSPKFDMTPRQAATAYAVQRSGGTVMLVRKEADINRLRELIEAEHGTDEIVRRTVRVSVMEEFTRYLLETFTEQARAQQEAALRAQMAGNNALLQARMGQLAAMKQQAAQAQQHSWANVTTIPAGGQPIGTVTTNTISAKPTISKLLQWIDPSA